MLLMISFIAESLRVQHHIGLMIDPDLNQKTDGGTMLDEFSLTEVSRSSSGDLFVPRSLPVGRPVTVASPPAASQGGRSTTAPSVGAHPRRANGAVMPTVAGSPGTIAGDFVTALALLDAMLGVSRQPGSEETVRTHVPRRAQPPRLMAEKPPDTKSPLNLIPFLQRDVPAEQQPAVELKQLQRQPFYNWAKDDEGYRDKLFALYRFITLFASLPIAYVTYNRLPFELPQLLLSANIGTFAVMLAFVARLRVGYGFVSQRLREKETYFEAQQRGLIFRKDRETVLRDRLTEESQVAPALKRIDASLAALFVALFLTLGSGEALTIIEGEAGPATLKTVIGSDAQDYTNRLKGDASFAKREQERALRRGDADGTGVKPVYCDSRYYKIIAGGGGCD